MGNKSIVKAYLAVQAIIWAKCLAFFWLFGSGTPMFFNIYRFPAWAIDFDFLFHQSMHVAIGLLALGFGFNLKKTGFSTLLPIVFVAVFLHNVFYWFTAFAGLGYHLEDFVLDYILLLSFVLLGFYLKKQVFFGGVNNGIESS